MKLRSIVSEEMFTHCFGCVVVAVVVVVFDLKGVICIGAYFRNFTVVVGV